MEEEEQRRRQKLQLSIRLVAVAEVNNGGLTNNGVFRKLSLKGRCWAGRSIPG